MKNTPTQESVSLSAFAPDYRKSERDFLTSKYVRIMFDYASSGVWDKNGAMVSESWLPIESKLIIRIREWSAKYDTDAWDLQKLQKDLKQGKIGAIALGLKKRLEDSCVEHFKESVLIGAQIKKILPPWTVHIYNKYPHILKLPIDAKKNSLITSSEIYFES